MARFSPDRSIATRAKVSTTVDRARVRAGQFNISELHDAGRVQPVSRNSATVDPTYIPWLTTAQTVTITDKDGTDAVARLQRPNA